MFDFQGLGTKQVQLADIKLTANQIKLSQDILDFLGHNNDENNIFIDKDRRTGKFWISSMPATEGTPGKKLSKNDSFGSQGLHHAMGGQYSEWKVEKLENETFEGITYYVLSQTVDGTDKRAELEELSKGFDAEPTVEEISENIEYDEIPDPEPIEELHEESNEIEDLPEGDDTF